MAESTDLRATPDENFIASVRQSFPVEPEIDRVLTRKLRHRSGPGYTAISIESLADRAADLIRSHIGDDFVLSDARWLGGGASKLQMAFHLEWTEAGERRAQDMVLRMEPPAAIVETSRRREFEALNAVSGTVPVPRCRWFDADARFLPYPALIYDFATGVAKPSSDPGTQVTGIGTNFGPDPRPILAEQFVDHMAAVHTMPAETFAALSSFAPARTGTNESVIRQINWWYRVWEEDRPEDCPLVDVAARWLIANAPPLDHVSLVHGDFRAGNFLYDEGTRRITAWLDWELAVLGDRHQDIAWATGAHFGHYAEDGATFLVSGLLPVDVLYARYEAASGLPIDPERLRYYRIFNDFMSCVHMLATAPRVAGGGKTHQDVVVGWLAMIGNVIAGKLRNTLAEVI